MFSKKEYDKEWRNKNKEHLSKYNKEYWKKVKGTEKDYYWKNHEVMLERHKKYREDNREKLRERSRVWAKNHKEQIRKKSHADYVKKYKLKKQYLDNYKLSRGCATCGYNKCSEALDFHHNNDKDFMVSQGAYNINNEKIKNEMDKCIILCANCHRELHAKEKNYKECD